MVSLISYVFLAAKNGREIFNLQPLPHQWLWYCIFLPVILFISINIYHQKEIMCYQSLYLCGMNTYKNLERIKFSDSGWYSHSNAPYFGVHECKNFKLLKIRLCITPLCSFRYHYLIFIILTNFSQFPVYLPCRSTVCSKLYVQRFTIQSSFVPSTSVHYRLLLPRVFNSGHIFEVTYSHQVYPANVHGGYICAVHRGVS